MPKHDFGIMPETPEKHRRYDAYTPEKYNCIAVDDRYISDIAESLHVLKCYWHTTDRQEQGLAYYGITLIPPESVRQFMEIISDKPEFNELAVLLWEAGNSDKFVIHYGI